jgi:hypothetical protein
MRQLRIGHLADVAEPLRYRAAALPAFVVPLLVLVAVLGYLVGHTHSGGGSSGVARTARSADVVFQYPPGWAPVSSGPQLDGLSLSQATRVAPSGQAQRAGLLVGSLPANDPGPLPASFVARLTQLPQTAIVNLIEAQAYRYTQLHVRGFAPTLTLTLFAIPNPDGASTALACYAPSISSPYMRACEQTVAAVTVAGQSQTYQLSPEPKYAAELSATIRTLDRLRTSLERELHPQITAARAEQLTRALAAGFGEARTALTKLEPNAPVEQAQAVLASAIGQAAAGYEALGAAVTALSVPTYEAAQARVAAAEASVDKALENFALLGYIPAQSASSDAPS